MLMHRGSYTGADNTEAQPKDGVWKTIRRLVLSCIFLPIIIYITNIYFLGIFIRSLSSHSNNKTELIWFINLIDWLDFKQTRVLNLKEKWINEGKVLPFYTNA